MNAKQLLQTINNLINNIPNLSEEELTEVYDIADDFGVHGYGKELMNAYYNHTETGTFTWKCMWMCISCDDQYSEKCEYCLPEICSKCSSTTECLEKYNHGFRERPCETRCRLCDVLTMEADWVSNGNDGGMCESCNVCEGCWCPKEGKCTNHGNPPGKILFETGTEPLHPQLVHAMDHEYNRNYK